MEVSRSNGYGVAPTHGELQMQQDTREARVEQPSPQSQVQQIITNLQRQ